MKAMSVKIPLGRALKFQVDKAAREGRLHALCYRAYGREYIEANFCGQCSHKTICEREKTNVIIGQSQNTT